MNIILCDDDLQFLNYMKEYLTNQLSPTDSVSICTNYRDLKIALEEGCDLLFMDVQLPEENGIFISVDILKQYPNLPIIFISGYADEYYQQTFLNVRPYGFLRKPVDEHLLFQLIEKFRSEQRNLQPTYHYFKTLDGIERIAFDDIYFLENSHHLVYIYKNKETFTVRTTFSELLSLLPKDSFVQCHRGYIVNFNHVDSYQQKYFIMDDDAHTTIKISKLKIPEVHKRFVSFTKIVPSGNSFDEIIR